MNEKIFKGLGIVGGLEIAIGIITLVVGVAVGVLSIVIGGKTIGYKKDIML